jgi:hypothetical protein
VAGRSGTTGSADGTNGNARFNRPGGIAADAQTNLYVADWGNKTVRMITPVGTNWVVTTIAGLAGASGWLDGTNSDARFTGPSGVALDSLGNAYIADNYAVRKLSRSGTNWVVTTITGSQPPLKNPNGLVLDGLGNIYVADTDQSVIRFAQPIPTLALNFFPGQAVLSWPLNASNYQLESSAVVPAIAWTPLTNGITVSGGNFLLTNGTSADSAFYRLHKTP